MGLVGQKDKVRRHSHEKRPGADMSVGTFYPWENRETPTGPSKKKQEGIAECGCRFIKERILGKGGFVHIKEKQRFATSPSNGSGEKKGGNSYEAAKGEKEESRI